MEPRARLAELKKPEVREAIINGAPISWRQPIMMAMACRRTGHWRADYARFNNMFRLIQDGVPNYEPRPEDSIAEIAKAEDKAAAEVVYDMLMENDGRGYVFCRFELCQSELRPHP